MTDQRKYFVEAYFKLGNGTMSVREAGYKDSPSFVNQVSKLNHELAGEFSEELKANFISVAPKSLEI